MFHYGRKQSWWTKTLRNEHRLTHTGNLYIKKKGVPLYYHVYVLCIMYYVYVYVLSMEVFLKEIKIEFVYGGRHSWKSKTVRTEHRLT